MALTPLWFKRYFCNSDIQEITFNFTFQNGGTNREW